MQVKLCHCVSIHPKVEFRVSFELYPKRWNDLWENTKKIFLFHEWIFRKILTGVFNNDRMPISIPFIDAFTNRQFRFLCWMSVSLFLSVKSLNQFSVLATTIPYKRALIVFIKRHFDTSNSYFQEIKNKFLKQTASGRRLNARTSKSQTLTECKVLAVSTLLAYMPDVRKPPNVICYR